jgi:hypothetical protein
VDLEIMNLPGVLFYDTSDLHMRVSMMLEDRPLVANDGASRLIGDTTPTVRIQSPGP